MERLETQDIEDLLQDLEEEDRKQDLPPEAVAELLRDLQADSIDTKKAAAERLGRLDASSPEIVRALVVAKETDSVYAVRKAAGEALGASVHQEYLQQATLVPSTILEHFQVETQGGTLRISWRPDLLQRVRAAYIPLLLLAVSIIVLTTGGSSLLHLLSYALGFASGYWLPAVFVNSTTITAGPEEWIILKGPFPLPTRHLNLRTRRLDPTAYSRVWYDRLGKKTGWSGSGESAEDELGSLSLVVASVLSGEDPRLRGGKELIASSRLLARCEDGSDKELLAALSWEEARSLKKMLQNLLELGGGPQAREGVDEVT